MYLYPSSSKSISAISMAVIVIANFGVFFNDIKYYYKKYIAENTKIAEVFRRGFKGQRL